MSFNECFFGNLTTFAIRFIPTENKSFAFAHLVLNGEVIGDKNEECYLGSWKTQLEYLRNTIVNETLFDTEFLNKSDREILELVIKSNQMANEYNLKYHYLPVLDDNIWKNCNVSIDETIDAYIITVVELNNKLKFIWKGLREPCPKNDIGKLKSVIVDKDFVIKTLEECLQQINTIH